MQYTGLVLLSWYLFDSFFWILCCQFPCHFICFSNVLCSCSSQDLCSCSFKYSDNCPILSQSLLIALSHFFKENFLRTTDFIFVVVNMPPYIIGFLLLRTFVSVCPFLFICVTIWLMHFSFRSLLSENKNHVYLFVLFICLFLFCLPFHPQHLPQILAHNRHSLYIWWMRMSAEHCPQL